MSYPVTLYVYDLSNGLAKSLSPFLLGRKIEGIWHTAIEVYGNEYFFGGHGIACCVPGTTQLGQPYKKQLLGDTHVSQEVFEDYLVGNSNGKFHGRSYNLLENNCNNFSDEVAKFLLGTGIDEDIIKLPQTVLSSPLGPLLRPHLEKVKVAPTDSQTFTSGNGDQLSNYIVDDASRESIMYSPVFSPVSPFNDEDIEILKTLDPSLPTVIERGPLSADDIPFIIATFEVDVSLFCRVISTLASKPGFVRIMLGDKAILEKVIHVIKASSNPAVENNLIAGLNQAKRSSNVLVELILGNVTRFLLSENSEEVSDAADARFRCTYNLCGYDLVEDDTIELGSALLHTIPDFTPDDKASSLDPKNKQPQSKEKIKEKINMHRNFLKTLFLLMLKNRQVVDLYMAMDKHLDYYLQYSDLSGLVQQITQFVNS